MSTPKSPNREKELEGVDLLGLAPFHLASWEETDGRVTVVRPPPSTKGARRILDGVLHKLSAKRIRLDEVGSFSWIHFDGERTVQEVADLLRAEFGERVDPVEERLGHLVRLLRTEDLLGYAGWDDPA